VNRSVGSNRPPVADSLARDLAERHREHGRRTVAAKEGTPVVTEIAKARVDVDQRDVVVRRRSRESVERATP
jgi:hypothetical protein